MEHNIGWDSIPEDFVVEVAHIVVNETLVTIGRPATAILIKIVTANDNPYAYSALSKRTTPAHTSTTKTTDNNNDIGMKGETTTVLTGTDGPTTTTSALNLEDNKKTVFGYPALQMAIEREPHFLPTLVQRLQSQDYALCLNSLDLLTAMLETVTEEHQNELPEILEQFNTKKYIVVS